MKNKSIITSMSKLAGGPKASEYGSREEYLDAYYRWKQSQGLPIPKAYRDKFEYSPDTSESEVYTGDFNQVYIYISQLFKVLNTGGFKLSVYPDKNLYDSSTIDLAVTINRGFRGDSLCTFYIDRTNGELYDVIFHNYKFQPKLPKYIYEASDTSKYIQLPTQLNISMLELGNYDTFPQQKIYLAPTFDFSIRMTYLKSGGPFCYVSYDAPTTSSYGGWILTDDIDDYVADYQLGMNLGSRLAMKYYKKVKDIYNIDVPLPAISSSVSNPNISSSVMKEIEVEVHTDDPELESLVKDSPFFKKSGDGYLVNFTDLSLFNQELPAELKNKLKVKTKYGEQVAVISSANLDLTEYEAIALLAKYGYKEYGSGNSYIRTFYTADSEISIYVIDGIVADMASSEYGVLEAPSKQEFIDIISDRVPY